MRIDLLDILRGTALIGMILFHANYLLLYVFKFEYDIFSGGFMRIFGFIIALIFIILSGYVNAESYHGKSFRVILGKSLRRCIPLATIATAISVLTYSFFPEQRISWGIIHFFALSSLLQPFFSKSGSWIFLFIIISFLISEEIARITMQVPIFIPLGIQYPGYYSADYYPLFPWFSYILLGQGIQYLFEKSRVENWLRAMKFPKLRWVGFLGRHSLSVYVLHVPILYAFIFLFTTLL